MGIPFLSPCVTRKIEDFSSGLCLVYHITIKSSPENTMNKNTLEHAKKRRIVANCVYRFKKTKYVKKIYKDRKTIFVDKLFSQAIIGLFARQKQLCFGRTEE